MAERKIWARELQVQYKASVVKYCDVVGISRTAYYYEPKLTDDDEIIDVLNALVERHHWWGFPKCFKRLRKLGHRWHHKRVYRVYTELKLNLRRKGKKRLPNRNPEPLAEWHGYPEKIRVDNGSEFTADVFVNWAKAHDIMIDYIKPGCPYQNAYIERFNRTYRDDVLDCYIFNNLNEGKQITEDWIELYNNERPHDSLNDMTPFEYRNAA